MSKGKYNRKKQHSRKHAQQNAASPPTLDERVNPKTKAEAGAKREDETKCKEEQRMGLRERIKRSSVTDWLLTLFTLVLAATAIYHFIILRGQRDVMRKDQRAWIAVTQKINSVITVDAAPSTTLTITDTGKTPATHVVAHACLEVVTEGREPHFDEPGMHTIMTAGVLPPNVPTEMTVVRRRFKVGGKTREAEDNPLTLEEKASLDDGKAWMALHGIIWYDDIFKTRHWIKFCRWSTAKPGTYHAAGCTSYNSVDND